MTTKTIQLACLSLMILFCSWGCNTHDPFKTAIYRAQEKHIIKSIQELKSSHYSWTPKNRAKRRKLEAELKEVQSYLKDFS